MTNTPLIIIIPVAHPSRMSRYSCLPLSHSLTLHIHSTRYRVCVLYLVVCYIVCFVPVRWILISSEWGRGDVEQQQQHATCIVSLWSQQTPPLLCYVPQHNCRPRLPVPHTSHADSNWTTIKARALYSVQLFSVVCVTTINQLHPSREHSSRRRLICIHVRWAWNVSVATSSVSLPHTIRPSALNHPRIPQSQPSHSHSSFQRSER